ncbi:flagellar filament capping protein FliD [Salisediminibacterium beveridgei]|uniref:Flagellar hook-associated protein 2 n=1 Tax=Salisediminibacterium beveridgei TaxID=632773 RepID=A0A1D7QSD5_9BACI|nr:flagellar filament capping protein FliD [Salisediminibacterium beveridgei]AOM81930.1 Flagellar hook-associated protein FliD [Salisediminibacterium beveridgei]
MDMRMTGFASGMDINQMVSDLMRAERQPMERMEQDQQELILQMDKYREVNRDFMQFRDNTFDSVLRSSNMTAQNATSSNEAAVSASASTAAAQGTYTFSDVSLAESTTNVSEDRIGPEGADYNDSLTEVFGEDLETENGKVSFDITTYGPDGETIDGNFSFDPDNTTLSEVFSEISNSDLGIQAYFDTDGGRVSLTRTDTGSFNDEGPEINFQTNGEESAFFNNNLNLYTESAEDEDGNTIIAGEQAGSNARFTMNGLAMERQSNSFDIDGLRVDLNQNMGNGQQATVRVETDTDNIVENITAFVDEYNDMISGLDEVVSEEYYRDYAPLTQDQMREMEEHEIENWNERAESGLLRRDSTINNALNQFRMDFYNSVDTGDENQSFSQLTEIGITTTSDFRDRGKLEINEAELRNAVEQDAEGVFQLFAADGEEGNSEQRGIAHRLRDTASNAINEIGNRVGRTESPGSMQNSTLGRELLSVEDQMSNFERRMQQVEERYWSQFTAMEQAMAEANAQAEQMMSQLGGMQGQ